MLVGARNSGDAGEGSAYLFDFDLNDTSIVAKFEADSATAEQFGWSVALSGDTALVSSHEEDG